MIFLNGQFMPIEDAKISVLDRGFIYGDGVYEYVPVVARKPYRMMPHLVRLDNSCRAIRLKNSYTEAQWVDIITKLIAKQNFDNQGVYWQVTRGVAKRDHVFPKDVEPTVFMMANPLPKLTQKQIDEGVACYTYPDLRWHHCNIKSISLLGNVLARQHAADRDGIETVMLRDGFLTEASSSNVFAVINGTIISPLKDDRILIGITLDAVIDLAQKHDFKLALRPVSEAEMWAADELWLSSSSKGVVAITRLDDKPIGNAAHHGKPGPVFKRMFALVQADMGYA